MLLFFSPPQECKGGWLREKGLECVSCNKLWRALWGPKGYDKSGMVDQLRDDAKHELHMEDVAKLEDNGEADGNESDSKSKQKSGKRKRLATVEGVK